MASTINTSNSLTTGLISTEDAVFLTQSVEKWNNQPASSFTITAGTASDTITL